MKERKKKGMKVKSEREKNDYMNQRADATFMDADVDRANRSHYARALKTFLVLYGTCIDASLYT